MVRVKTPVGAKISSFLILLLAIIMFAGFFAIENILSPLEEEVKVTIPAGASTRQIGSILEEKGVIGDSNFFRIVVRIMDWENSLRRGRYSFNPEHHIFSVIEKIARGDVLTYRVIVPEGLTMEQTAQLIADKSGDFSSKEFLKQAEEIELPFAYLPEEKEKMDYRLQGYLFPATYEFPQGSAPRDIIKQMVERFDWELNPELMERAREMGFDIHEIVTLASLVEREARIEEERPYIASVIHNRLEIDMPLQIDATVQYALPEWKSRLLFVDLNYDSPYNTYLHRGLPPGPIASPGQSSLLGALYPAETDYLFYIANPDGSHSFSRTFEEHRQLRPR